MRYLLSSFFLLSVAAIGCSVANSPDDPKQATSSSTASTNPTGGGEGGSNTGGNSSVGGTGGTGGSPAVCGDGMINGDEECDGAGMETAECNLDCTKAVCGDNKVNRAAKEECDNGSDGNPACDKNCKATAFTISESPNAVGFATLFVRAKVTTTSASATAPESFLVTHLDIQSATNPIQSTLTGKLYDQAGVPAKAIINVANSGASPIAHDMATNAEGRSLVLIRDGDSALRYRTLAPGTGAAEGMQDEFVTAKSNKIELDSLPRVAAGSNGNFCTFYIDKTSQTGKTRAVSAMGSFSAVTNDLGAIGAGTSSALGGVTIGAAGSGFAIGYIDPSYEVQKLDKDCVATGKAIPVFNNATSQTSGSIDTIVGSPNNETILLGGYLDGTFLQAVEQSRSVVQRIDLMANSKGPVELTGSKHVDEFTSHLVRHPNGGEAIAIWTRESEGQSSGCELLLRRLNNNGKPTGETFGVALESPSKCAIFPNGTVNKDGDVMIAFTEYETDQTISVATKTRSIIYRRLLAPQPTQ